MRYTITKAIAKHGKDAVVVIPRLLKKQLQPGMLVRIDFTVLEERE